MVISILFSVLIVSWGWFGKRLINQLDRTTKLAETTALVLEKITTRLDELERRFSRR